MNTSSGSQNISGGNTSSNPAIGGGIQSAQVISTSPESEPIGLKKEKSVAKNSINNEAIVSPATDEVIIPHELREILEKGPSDLKPKIDHEMLQAGIKEAKESLPIIHTPSGDITLPMTLPDAKIIKKTTKDDKSPHWLAEMIIYIWKKFAPETFAKSVK